MADYRKIFQDSIVLSQSQPAKVNQHGDYYAIQAAHLLLDVYRETGERERERVNGLVVK